MSANAKWLPGDAELDRVALTLPASTPDAHRAEQNRTALLASANSVAQQPRGSRPGIFVAIGAALAAAAAVLIWVVARPTGESVTKERITAIGEASFDRVSPWPDLVVRLDDGRVAIELASLDPAERFRVKTTDAEIESRGAKLTVDVAAGRLVAMAVSEGRVELRSAGQPAVFVSAGQTWPVWTAHADLVPADAGSPPVVIVEERAAKTERVHVGPGSEPTIDATRPISSKPRADSRREPAASTAGAITPVPVTAPLPTKADLSTRTAPTAATSSTTRTSITPAPSPKLDSSPSAPLAPKPGEQEFRNGVTSLRSGDATAATRSFATACTAAGGDALGEDACFWVGAAAKRSGDVSTARAALARFLERFPRSARAGEASALLGWLLYDAGELDAAEAHFRDAANDRVPKVRDSATRGLSSVARRRE